MAFQFSGFRHRCPRSFSLWLSGYLFLLLLFQTPTLLAQATYCNPLNLDYAFKPSRHRYYGMDESHRSTADPAVVNYKGNIYLFSTNQQGYWWTDDLEHWHFVRHSFKVNRSNDDVCAPAAWAWGDTLLFMPSHMDRDNIPLYMSTDPQHGVWTTLVDSFSIIFVPLQTHQSKVHKVHLLPNLRNSI